MWEAIIIKPFINTLLFIYNLIGQNLALRSFYLRS